MLLIIYCSGMVLAAVFQGCISSQWKEDPLALLLMATSEPRSLLTNTIIISLPRYKNTGLMCNKMQKSAIAFNKAINIIA